MWESRKGRDLQRPWDMRNVHKILVRNFGKQRTLGISLREGENDIKINPKEEVWDGSRLDQSGSRWGVQRWVIVNRAVRLRLPLTAGNFCDQPNNCQLLKYDSAALDLLRHLSKFSCRDWHIERVYHLHFERRGHDGTSRKFVAFFPH